MPTILLVDHETDSLDTYKNFLMKRGFDVEDILTAQDGQDALDKLTNYTVDVCVIDIALPKLSGIEVVRECEFRRIPTQFIFLTGFGQGDKVFEQAMRAYNVRFIIEKGCIVMSDFLQKLKQCLANGREKQ